MTFDFVILGAPVYPGDGPPAQVDVAIQGQRIAVVGRADGLQARERLDGRGLMLCPGFIDLHSHSGLRPFVDPLVSAKVAQGFTTELINPDGLSPAPVATDAWLQRRAYLAPIEGAGPDRASWGSVDQYLAALEAARPATSLVACVGHGAVREHVMGRQDRAPTTDELARMREEVRSGLEAGARCLSFGLIYAPGMFAATDELIELAREAARFGAPLVPHVRNEGAGVIGAVQEMVDVARLSGAPLHVSHLKVIDNEDLVGSLLDLIDDAARDVDLTFDQYPYGAGSTMLAALLPPWAHAGGREATLRLLSEPGARRRIAREMETGIPGWENIYGSCGPDRITIVDTPPTHADLIGRSLAEIGESRSADPTVAVLAILLESGLAVTMVDHYATEAVVRRIFAHPLALVGSDGIYGPHPHPRLYASAARVLGRYALRERLITMEEAVARLSARPAARLGLTDRGRVKEGLRADLVLLDPTAYVDTATYEDPDRSPPGVAAVFVGGRPVHRAGHGTGERPGAVLRSPMRRHS